MEAENDGMGGGHCYGMSVMSLLLYKDQLPAGRRQGTPDGPAFGLPRTDGLERNIAYTWAWQHLPAVRGNWFEDDPKAVLEQLIKELRAGGPETSTLVFWTRDVQQGHAITPYAVEDKGNGQFAILTYDNNYPGKTAPFLVDTIKNTWRYDHAALNPGQAADAWDGDATTETTQLASTTRGLGTQPCFFCPKSKQKTEQRQVNQISLDGDAVNHPNLLITDAEGRSTGIRGGQPVNEIPGAELLAELSADPTQDKPEPRYEIPVSAGDLKITIDGRRQTKTAKSDLTIIGPGQYAQIDDIKTAPGEIGRVQVGKRAAWVRYKTARRESPNVSIGFEGAGGVAWSFSALATGVKKNNALEFRVKKDKGRVTFSNSGAKGRYSLAAFRDTKRQSPDWGADFDISGKVRATIAYNRRIRDDNGKRGLPITWKESRRSYTDALDRGYQAR
jgi:hypothetical protein